MPATGGLGYDRLAAALVVMLVAAFLATGCGGSDAVDSEPPRGEVRFDGAGHPNFDAFNSRRTWGPINSSTVDELEVAWSTPIAANGPSGGYASSPIVSKGVIYSQDLASNVQAIEASGGDVLWERRYDLPSPGPNGLVVQDGMVFGATPSSTFALDQRTGKQIWSVRLTRNKHEGIDMAPAFNDRIIYVSTVPADASESYGAGAVGVLWALDAETGKKLWHFDTVPRTLWGDPRVNSGGGLRYTPSFDIKASMYFGVGSPAPFPGTAKKPWGSSRAGPNLYTDALVKLDSRTGKLEWYRQVTPHALYDWGFQSPPIIIYDEGEETVIGAGKSGIVLALDARSGEPLWRVSVGTHNGHDDDGLLAMRGETSKLELPMTVYPGSLGGVAAPMATDRESVFVPVVNSPVEVIGQTELREPGPLSGELVALDVKSGELEWRHEFPDSAPLGFVSVANDVVFATTADGSLQALDTATGSVLWEETLPAGTNAGVSISGKTVIAPAGLAAEGQTPQLVAFRLGG
jgi:outer membrane protein assembly factor BamB